MMTIETTIAFAVLVLMWAQSASGDMLLVDPCFGACAHKRTLAFFAFRQDQRLPWHSQCVRKICLLPQR
jgi:hypothetical protein